MKKGQTINDTLNLLMQDIGYFYNMKPEDFIAFGKTKEPITSARFALCYVAYIISPNLFNTDTLARKLKKSTALISKWIKLGQNVKGIQELKAHLKTQGWEL